MEITRRDALIGALLPLLRMAPLGAQTAQQPARPPVFQHDLPNLTMEDWQVTVNEITLAPGSVGQPHRHPGFVLVYVLEGEVVAKVSDSPQATYSAGQVFYEHPGSTHEVNRNASATKPARFLALIFAKKGLPLTAPA
jgi:quercetin dioxygenase-like cupin family protein